VDRRAFLAGATAAVAAACASPERELVTQADIDAVDLTVDRPLVSAPIGEPTVVDADDALDIPDEDLVGLVLVAEAAGPTVEVRDGPGGELIHTFADPIPSGGPLVFVVDELGADGWHRMLLPVRPNGSTGWVKESSVTFTRHNYRILVELDRFHLTVFDHERPVFETTVGVATENTPTPGGRYYITELIQPTVSDSVYGAYAYGLSGYSEVLEEFAGGDGQLGLHGTNDPDSIGTRVSNGCIRMRNEDIIHLVTIEGIPLGTPVEVV
jgi:lipoprotein-anchoring transpeptidase ErfK/SrfK